MPETQTYLFQPCFRHAKCSDGRWRHSRYSIGMKPSSKPSGSNTVEPDFQGAACALTLQGTK